MVYGDVTLYVNYAAKRRAVDASLEIPAILRQTDHTGALQRSDVSDRTAGTCGQTNAVYRQEVSGAALLADLADRDIARLLRPPFQEGQESVAAA